MAHDLIHIVFAHFYRANCRKTVSPLVVAAYFSHPLSVHRADRVGNGPGVWGTEVIASTCAGWHKTKRPGLGLSHKALSRSALPQALLKHRIEPRLLLVNGTEVPDDITLRPYWDSPPCLNFCRLVAGHSTSGDKAQWVHGSMLLPSVQPSESSGAKSLTLLTFGGLWPAFAPTRYRLGYFDAASGRSTGGKSTPLRRIMVVLALSFLLSQQLLSQTPSQAPTSGSSPPPTSGAPRNNLAKPRCTDNGTYVNRWGKQ